MTDWRCGCKRHHPEDRKACERCGYERPHRPATEDAFWLIESHRFGNQFIWWAGWDGAGSFRWTDDVNEAMRYATKAHAEQVIRDTHRMAHPDAIATEHGWMPRHPEVTP